MFYRAMTNYWCAPLFACQAATVALMSAAAEPWFRAFEIHQPEQVAVGNVAGDNVVCLETWKHRRDRGAHAA